MTNDMVKVGLRYGSSALFSANLENAVGSGYEFGYFEEDRSFTSLGWTEETAVSMTAAGTIYMDGSGTYSPSVPAGGFRAMGGWHVQIGGFRSFEEASARARSEGGWPAWVDWEHVVRIGCYESQGEAEAAAGQYGGRAIQSSSTGVVVTRTRTTDILFEFDCSGVHALGVRPSGRETSTWFKGYQYGGGFEYPRITGGNLNVVNVVGLEDYVKGVIPYEMGGAWPLEALEAQAVCARTFVQGHSKHLRESGFDVCNGVDCQVYNGHGSGGTGPSETSDQAVENTAGLCIYYNGTLVQDAVYHSSDGGATEDGANVWGTETGYLKGKADPYEAQTTVPSNSYSVTYTASELSWILDQKGHSVGTVQDVYVSEYTPLGNVKQVTFVGTGGTKTFTGDDCRMIFYSSTYQKSVSSMRFDINGRRGGSGGLSVNGTGQLASLDGVSVISGGGTLGTLRGNTASAITSSGTVPVSGEARQPSSGGSSNGNFVITGTGNGHNVGMSQYGAKAMAELGYSSQEILNFYYTDITVR
ncbi:SpoIID/LytB domain-containing protein [uncultured Oscillibacter sp.]|uniref:SpoIID/LytB domain-containing protein n=3 Tax=uncultured Oscillibacter sp. TaxID=876091 RepID=UPI00263506A9|nr:SpoIID/LytB domain-containing protein [uncultured Oscillibacter sp.]